MPTRNLGVFAEVYLYPDIQHARRSSTSMSARRAATQDLLKKHGFVFRKLCMVERSLHFSCPSGLRDWSLEKGQSQCFNWSSIPAETTVRFFCLFSLEKAYRLLCTAFLIYPAICSRRLVVNQHQLELSQSFQVAIMI